MPFESEIPIIFSYTVFPLGFVLLIISLIGLKKAKRKAFLVVGTIFFLISMYLLKSLLFQIPDVDDVMISEHNTFDFYLFLIPFCLSIISYILYILTDVMLRHR
ncbi:putative membrane protein [Virgibacillus litoralis]|uniref:Membrane protein n=1 Tax=Virgibacillus litoralis TaxID=578221 RepID=A0ABS4H990_9BACI|nr:putative membrane protein [Virgibacillus litoralis]